MEIDEILDSIYVLPEVAKQKLIDCIAEVQYTKGHVLLRADRIEQKIYFIKEGIARGYVSYDDSEVTFWFGKEGDTVVSMQSYVNNKRGYEDIELLEDCWLYEISGAALQKLFAENIDVANWGRKFAELELIKTEERLIDLQFKTATERYKVLLEKSPDLIQRVQLGYIASYLGITQVSLSRIRSEIR